MPVSGLKIYSSKKHRYCYDRISGKRIHATIGTPEFHKELDAAREPTIPTAHLPVGSLGDVIARYTAEDSEDWSGLKPKTQESYRRAFKVLEKLRAVRMSEMTRGAILKLRNETIAPKHGRWMANYVVTVLGILFTFAVDNEIADIKVNPLEKKVKRIRKAVGEKEANRPWEPSECEAVLSAAPPQLLIPIALAMFAGLRKADILSAPLSAVKDGEISVRTSKRDKLIRIPQHPKLAAALAKRPVKPKKGKLAEKWQESTQIAITTHGMPWTESGFNASWIKFKQRLETNGKIAPGLTIHGLRHTLGTRLREAGADDRTIADILGQRSTSMARHYSDSAELPASARAMVLKMDPTKKRAKRS